MAKSACVTYDIAVDFDADLLPISPSFVPGLIFGAAQCAFSQSYFEAICPEVFLLLFLQVFALCD